MTPGSDHAVAAARLPVETVLTMLSVAYDLGRLSLPSGVEVLDAVFERAVSVIAERVADRVRRGLYRHDVERPDDLCFVQSGDESGGILSVLFRQDPYQRCRYDELTADLDDNRIMLWALHAASRTRLSDPDLARKVRDGYRALAGRMELNLANANACISRFYRQLHDAYRPEHGLCRLILEHVGPEVTDAGNRSVPFNLNPATLFAAYVTRWLKESLPIPYRLRDRYEARLAADGRLILAIDAVIEDEKTGVRVMAVDTRYDFSADADADDIARAAAHAARSNAPAAVIVYPCAPVRATRTESGGIAISAASFDLDRSLSAAGAGLLRQLELAAADNSC